MTKRMTMLILGLAAFLWAGVAWADESSAGAPPMQPCETDADCGDVPCVDGVCDWGTGDPWVPECETDADCGEEEFCLGDWCESTEGYCQSDADCGAYQYCADMGEDDVAVAIPEDAVPMPPPDDGEDDGSDSGEASSDAPEEAVDPIEETTWGTCIIDLDTVPVDEGCASLCEIMMACEGGGSAVSDPVEVDGPVPGEDDPSGGSGDDDLPGEEGGSATDAGDPDDSDGGESTDPVDPAVPADDDGDDDAALRARMTLFCTQACSYGVALGVGETELAEALACVEGQVEDDCDGLKVNCEEALAAYGETMESTFDDVDKAVGGGSDSTGIGIPEDGSNGPSDDEDRALSSSDKQSDEGGCQGGPMGSVAPLFGCLLLGLMLRRRRFLI